MNYWITTHYPPTKDDVKYDLTGVWIVDGKERVAEKLRPDDLVLIYQAKSGKSIIRQEIDGTRKIVGCIKGRGGVVSITRALTNLQKYPDTPETEYIDGQKRWWCWYAETEIISTNGFVSREDLNVLLGYKKNNVLKGFGNRHSGLKLITKDQFEKIVELFKKIPTKKDLSIDKALAKNNSYKKRNSVESKAHRDLKNYIASNPSEALNEDGLITIHKEYLFPTADKADLVLEDSFGRIIGLEVELKVEDWQLEGVLQAIKYRYMLELVKQRNIGEGRAILVAYSISPTIIKICKQYDVECITVDKKDVISWSQNKS